MHEGELPTEVLLRYHSTGTAPDLERSVAMRGYLPTLGGPTCSSMRSWNHFDDVEVKNSES